MLLAMTLESPDPCFLELLSSAGPPVRHVVRPIAVSDDDFDDDFEEEIEGEYDLEDDQYGEDFHKEFGHLTDDEPELSGDDEA